MNEKTEKGPSGSHSTFELINLGTVYAITKLLVYEFFRIYSLRAIPPRRMNPFQIPASTMR